MASPGPYRAPPGRDLSILDIYSYCKPSRFPPSYHRGRMSIPSCARSGPLIPRPTTFNHVAIRPKICYYPRILVLPLDALICASTDAQSSDLVRSGDSISSTSVSFNMPGPDPSDEVRSPSVTTLPASVGSDGHVHAGADRGSISRGDKLRTWTA